MFQYPWGDMHSLNLGWFLIQFKAWVDKIQEYLDNGGGTDENLANVIAPVFNAANSYLTGDYVMYNDELYKANEAISPGTWDPSKWTRCLAMEEISSGAGIDNVARLMIAENYSAHYGYQKYAICRYNDKLWMCNTNLPSGGEEWTPAHWDEITVGAGLTGLRRSVETLAGDITSLTSIINALTPFDTTPTSGSQKGITSGAVYTAVNNIESAQEYHVGDTYSFTIGATYFGFVGNAGNAAGAYIPLPKEIGNDVTGFSFSGNLNFWGDPAGRIVGATFSSIAKNASNQLIFSISFPEGTTRPANTVGFINMGTATITFT